MHSAILIVAVAALVGQGWPALPRSATSYDFPPIAPDSAVGEALTDAANVTINVTAEVKGTSQPFDDEASCKNGSCRVAPASEADESNCASCRSGATRPLAARRGLFRRWRVR